MMLSRRGFLALLGGAAASAAAAPMLGWFPVDPDVEVPLSFDQQRTLSALIATTIELRKHEIADLISKDNAFLKAMKARRV
jgi:hypothetical protein